MHWKDFFYFSQRERRGFVLLIVLIAGIFIGKYLFTPREVPDIISNQPIRDTIIIMNSPKENNTTDVYPIYSQNEQVKQERKTYSPPRQPETRTYYHQEKKEDNPSPTYQYPKTEKYPEGTQIELNASDTTQLKKIPGIGSSYAKRIVGYRNALGGFHRLEQLQEVYNMYEELYEKITPYLYVSTDSLRKLSVNTASLDRLKSHPYINFYQAKAIIEVRKKTGRVENIENLVLLEEFTEDDWTRLLPYLSFE